MQSGMQSMGAAKDCVDGVCCDCWKEGCGLDGMFGHIANCLECSAGPIEYCADLIWCFGSPLAFPLVFCFAAEPQNSQQAQGPGGGWEMSMLQAPARAPAMCCFGTCCPCCAQWVARRQALHGDMSKYKLWQGQHDGPQCLARSCPGAPITIRSGTYGEDKCPEAFLCLEVCILGGINSVCCAHRVTRRMVQQEYHLGKDPTEIRTDKCVQFFGTIMRTCCRCAMCLSCCSCLVGCCATESEGAQECSGEGARAARACFQIGMIIWRGIMSIKIISIGCMVAQQDFHIARYPTPPPPQAPKSMEMDERKSSFDKDQQDQQKQEGQQPGSKSESSSGTKKKKKKKKKQPESFEGEQEVPTNSNPKY